ncbi:hypothetical protein K523DRAFT_141762 [Schizophyllum commune Tattone D]|nr:hypothetical protein K523DRAFT_141762 [Schizophyllum commune Tattone D]
MGDIPEASIRCRLRPSTFTLLKFDRTAFPRPPLALKGHVPRLPVLSPPLSSPVQVRWASAALLTKSTLKDADKESHAAINQLAHRGVRGASSSLGSLSNLFRAWSSSRMSDISFFRPPWRLDNRSLARLADSHAPPPCHWDPLGNGRRGHYARGRP